MLLHVFPAHTFMGYAEQHIFYLRCLKTGFKTLSIKKKKNLFKTLTNLAYLPLSCLLILAWYGDWVHVLEPGRFQSFKSQFYHWAGKLRCDFYVDGPYSIFSTKIMW